MQGGLYVHVPFCVKKCAYCDFFSVSQTSLTPDYVAALLKEIERYATKSNWHMFTADTIYFGGGTPSLLEPADIASILNNIRQHFNVAPHAEITLEANPKTVDLTKLQGYYNAGVNRLSIGIQSFCNNKLALLGRLHSAAEAKQTFADARKAGFHNISIDIIFGLPGQTQAELVADLEAAIALQPEHISAYLLTLEPQVPLAMRIEREEVPVVAEDFQRAAFDLVRQTLTASGYKQYEISSFAKEGTGYDLRSRHNQKYWVGETYIGFGPGAHSFISPDYRSWNVSDVSSYIKRLNNDQDPKEGLEFLTAEQILIEKIYVGLRQSQGINTQKFAELTGNSFEDIFCNALQNLQADGLVIMTNGFCKLTEKGLPFLDHVAAQLVNDL